MQGFEASHSPQKIGCDACHLGNPKTINKDLAHKGMIIIPGNLSDAVETCGKTGCHPGIPERINNSLMNTMSGVISVNRYAFNEIDKPEGFFNVKALTHSNADDHNRNLCASCHLGNEKKDLGPVTELSRGGGCNACHLNYSDAAATQLDIYLKSLNRRQISDKNKIEPPKIHPQLNLRISDQHCFGCHSRSGRISTNYEGWYETLYSRDDVNGKKDYRYLADGRVFKKAADDVHHRAQMECIDCHVSMEIMGDGNLYQHMDEQVKVQCTDCHNHNVRKIRPDEIDPESKKIVELRNLQSDKKNFIATATSDLPLTNTYVTPSLYNFLITKSKNIKLKINSPAYICTGYDVHRRLNCQSCHTEWVSHCTGCHTMYESDLDGYDLLDNKEIKGSWNEVPSNFYIDYPVLGIRKNKSGKEIVDTFIPGMVMTIEKFKNPQKSIFKRLFAPSFSHTINKKGRSCISCHLNPLALGYGSGKLELLKSRRWLFTPVYKLLKEDGLPSDAWIGFLKERYENSTTRTYTRPFTIAEQKKILLVGACLSCHNQDDEFKNNCLSDFKSMLKKTTSNCIIPSY